MLVSCVDRQDSSEMTLKDFNIFHLKQKGLPQLILTASLTCTFSCSNVGHILFFAAKFFFLFPSGNICHSIENDFFTFSYCSCGVTNLSRTLQLSVTYCRASQLNFTVLQSSHRQRGHTPQSSLKQCMLIFGEMISLL